MLEETVFPSRGFSMVLHDCVPQNMALAPKRPTTSRCYRAWQTLVNRRLLPGNPRLLCADRHR